MFWIALVFFVFAVLFAVERFSKREGYYSTLSVFGISTFVYYIAIPLEARVTGQNWIIVSGRLHTIDEATQTGIVAMAVLAFVGFAVGYRLAWYLGSRARLRAPGALLPQEEGPSRMPSNLVLLVGTTLGVLLVLYTPQIRSAGTYFGSYTTTYLNPVFAYGASLFAFVCAALAAWFILQSGRLRMPALLLTFLVIGWGFYSSNKNPILIGGLGLGALMATPRFSKSRLLGMSFLVGAILLAMSTPLFSLYRALGNLQLEDLLQAQISFRYSDPAGPMVSLLHELHSDGELMLGRSYLHATVAWVPRFVWSGRPLDLSQQFAQENIEGWQPGEGMGYSLLAESVRNFGWFGPIIQYIGIGLVWGLVWLAVGVLVRRAGRNHVRALYVTVGFYLLVLMHRGPSSGIITSLIQILVPVILMHVVFGRINFRLVRFRRRSTAFRIERSRRGQSGFPQLDSITLEGRP